MMSTVPFPSESLNLDSFKFLTNPCNKFRRQKSIINLDSFWAKTTVKVASAGIRIHQLQLEKDGSSSSSSDDDDERTSTT
jgi:hypothetical protein